MKRIVSVLISVVLLLSITAGISISAYAGVFGYIDPLSDKYVVDKTANQFDFFEVRHSIEELKQGEQKNFNSFKNHDDEALDEYALKIGIVSSNGTANTSLTEYERIAKIYQYLHITHIYDISKSFSGEDAIINRRGYCETFSWTVKALCKRAGIECWEIAGPAAHAWNIVKIDGKYYAIDVARKKFLTEPSAGISTWKTDESTVSSANSNTCYAENTGNGTGVQQWIKKVGSSNLATSTYSKITIDEYGDLINPKTTLSTPSVVSTTATSEGVIVKFKGVSNADWYEVYTAPIDGVMNGVSIERWDKVTKYDGDFVYYKQSYLYGDFNFTKAATVHSIDKNESGQYQCFLENGDGNGLIVFIVAKNVKGQCNLVADSYLTSANTEKAISLIGKNYLKPADEGTDKTTKKKVTNITAAQINSTNYALYKSNAKHLATNGNHSYTKIKTIRAAGAGTQGADLYECKNCLQRQIRYTAALSTSSLATPKISSISANNSGTVITWGKVSGAAKYRVFYRIGNGAWTKIADTTSTSYTWKNAKAGTKYTYTVRCISSDGKVYTSGFESAGKTFTTAATPKISYITADNSGTVISWKAAAGAQNYRVYRKTASGDWVAIATTKATGFTDKTAAKGTKYFYTVRCLTADSKTYASGYDTNGTVFTACAAPKLTVVSSGATSITISWNKVAGAQKYRVFYRNSSGGWTKIADTTATSFTCNGAKPGTRYTYTVRCVNSAGTVYTGGWDNAGKSIVK